jgi:UDP-N-acetyl-D-mannosaminuronate dehydrogenase
VLLLGVSYRGDVGDTRYSPVEKLYNYLSEAGAIITCHDPYVKFWDEQSLEIDKDLTTHLSNSVDVIIISTGHTIYKKQKTIDALYNLDSVFIYDTIGLLSANQIEYLQQKHTIKVLGRGDL